MWRQLAVLACVLACLLAAPAAGQTATLTVRAGRFFRQSVPALLGVDVGNASLLVQEAGLPAAPSWLSLVLDPADSSTAWLAGTAPPLRQPLQLQLVVVRRPSPQANVAATVVPFTLRVQAVTQALPVRAATLRLEHLNRTQLVVNDTLYSALQTAVAVVGAQLPQTPGPNYWILHNIRAGEDEERNVPPNTFSPPMPPPNYYLVATVKVAMAVTETNAVVRCSDVMGVGSAEAAFADSGFVVLGCEDEEVFLSVPSTGAVGQLASVESQAWRRDRKDFDNTVLPAVIISGLLVLGGICVTILHCYTKSDSEEKLQQQQRLILNKLGRNRTHAFRFDHQGYSALASQRNSVAPRPGAGYQTMTAKATVPEEVSMTEEVAPPPTYRPPPQHRF